MVCSYLTVSMMGCEPATVELSVSCFINDMLEIYLEVFKACNNNLQTDTFMDNPLRGKVSQNIINYSI